MENIEPEKNIKKMLFNVITSIMALSILLAVLFYYAVKMPGDALQKNLSPISLEQSSLSKRLESHVYHISETIGERSAGQPIKLNETADYIQQQFESFGYIPTNRVFGTIG